MATPGPVLGRHPAREANHGGAALVVLGAGALAAYVYWRDHQGTTTPPPPSCPCGGGAACNPSNGRCSARSGQAANLPTGLYVSYFDVAKTIGTTWWNVEGQGRWGVPSVAQLTRCWGANPTIVDVSTVGGFGNADHLDDEYVGTIGYVSACTKCPPGSPGFASGA